MVKLRKRGKSRTSSSQKTLIASSAVLLVIFGLFLLVLWRFKFLSFTGTDPSSKVVSATIALVGAFIGSIVSAVGLLLKHSIDTRTEDRLELDTRRNAVLQREAEDRQKLEACIRAVQLLATTSGKPSPAIQLMGVLFSLVSLGQHELTLHLVFDLLDRGVIGGAEAAAVIDRALRCKDQDLRARVISNLESRADRLLTPRGVAVPESIMQESSSFDRIGRGWIPALLGRVMAARPLAQWQQEKYELFAFAIIESLCLAWSKESEADIKNDIGTILSRLLKAFPEADIVIDLTQIRSELDSLTAPNIAVGKVAKILDNWMGQASLSRGPVAVGVADTSV